MTRMVLASGLLAALTAGFQVQAQTNPEAGARSHAVPLIRLPNGDYTVPMSELQGSGVTGNVTLRPQGLRTLITITVFGNRARTYALRIHPGRDCNALYPASSIALRPAVPGQPSRTIVELPISSLNNYLITAQDTTERTQYQEACARL